MRKGCIENKTQLKVLIEVVQSAPREIFAFVASLEAGFGRVEALLTCSEQRPVGGLRRVIRRGENLFAAALLVGPGQVLETIIVDPRMPLAIHLKLKTEEYKR